MPYYYKLKIDEKDNEPRKREKQYIADKLLKLRQAIAQHIGNSVCNADGEENYKHSDDSSQILRLATWNIREFDSNKYGKRLEESFYYIAEIMSNFDLIAVQEVRDDITALKKVIRILGPTWSYIASDVTEGTSGNRERMTFVYNKSKIWFRNVAGELVLAAGDRISYPFEERLTFNESLNLQLPPETSLKSPAGVKTYKRNNKRYLKQEISIKLPEGTKVTIPSGSEVIFPKGYEVELTESEEIILPTDTDISLKEKGKNKEVMIKLPKGAIVGDLLQFARTPSIVAFQCGWLKITLCTVHIYYGSGKEGLSRRKNEILHLTEFLAKKAKQENDSDRDSFFIVLGDFNIVDRDHETMHALKTNGFLVPQALQSLSGSSVDRSKYYDQIAYWSDPDLEGFAGSGVTKIEVHRAGIFDYFKTVFREGDFDPQGADKAHYTALKEFKDSWEYKVWRTYQMSDHLPMWIELRIDFSDEYLEQIVNTP